MIRYDFVIWEHNWIVRTYFAVSCYYADEILGRLQNIGADAEIMRSANRNLRACTLDTGLTYTSPWHRETIMVVGLTSSPEEFFNSFLHELKHLEEQIGEAIGIDQKSEEAAYFRGGVARELFPYISSMLCEHCRKKVGKCACGH